MNEPGFTHTPGPWLIHAYRRWIVPAGDAFAEPADALPICQLRDPDERLTEDETLANGFLIAAAPELYDALDELATAVEENPEALPGAQDAAISAAYDKALSALTKARGETAQPTAGD